MPAFVPIIIGAAAGLVGGYVADHYLGDGEYSAGEAAFDAAGGALGGSLVKPGITVGGRVFTVGRAHFSKSSSFSFADDAVGTTAAIVSGNIRPIGIAASTSYLGDQYTLAQSSASRSERNASKVGAGGTPSRKKLDSRFSYKVKNQYDRARYRDGLRGPCKKGYVLHRATNGVWHCVKK